MSHAPRSNSCAECGEALALFQPVCEECETAHEWTYRAACHDCGEQVSYTDEECPECGAPLSIWRALEADVLSRDEPIAIWKDRVPRPTDAGYRIHFGSIHGQWADYRRSLGDGDLHIRSYPRRYELHYDDVSAVESPGRHLLRHGAPAATASGVDLALRIGRAVAESGRFLAGPIRSPETWLSRQHDSEDGSAN
jgi:hypothetical protein